jgi:glycosyltransferase involved in cell wall biosynthesis
MLSIVVPALNESAGIHDAMLAFVGRGRLLVDRGVLAEVEVVIVDDGSTDDTAQVVRSLARTTPEIRMVQHPSNRGLGAALRSGFGAARGQLVFYTDADLPVGLEALDRAIALMTDDVDAVSAYRRSRSGEGPRRFAYSLAYNALCRVALGIRVRDVNFAAKLLRAEQLHQLDLRSEGSFIDAEILARLHHASGTIAQFPADYQPRSKGVSTLSSARVILTIAREMVSITPDIWRSRPLRTLATT